MGSKLLLAAGGTGGHMFPAQALAETLRADGWSVAMITDARGRRHTGRIPADPIFDVEAASISPRRPVAAVGGVLKLQRGTRTAKRVLRDWRPDVVAGFGGYPAFPALRAAQALRVPYVLHEQNTVLGRVNRLFARRAVAVASGFETLERLPPRAKHVTTGNPLRAAVLDAVPARYTAPVPDGDIRLLVVGGSLGARIIAETVPTAVARLPGELRARLRVVQQTPEGQLEAAREAYAAAGVKAELATFFADIQDHLARAHLVVGRAGASSVSEFAAMGLPSVLVPLAIAMDDHQTVNARTLERHGAAVILSEAELSPARLAEVLQRRLKDADWLASAARAARAQGRPDAAARLADLVRAAAGALSQGN